LSISLTTRPRTPSFRATHEVPIATHEVFRRFWAPACEALQLRWVPMFATGIPLDQADVVDVLSELEALRAWTEQHSEARDTIGQRLDGLISELRALEGASDDLELYVG